MKKILTNLRENWITYGFETLVVIAGILGAFALNNWNEGRKEDAQDIEYLKNLRIELEKDLASFTHQRENYIRINSGIEKSLRILESDQLSSKEDSLIIEQSLSWFQILTPVYQNIERNEILLASGALRRFGEEIDHVYLDYVQKADHHGDILEKFGETLQQIGIHNIWPYVDYKSDSVDTWIHFDFDEIRSQRSVRNGLNQSLTMRRTYLNWLSEQETLANRLVELIDLHVNE